MNPIRDGLHWQESFGTYQLDIRSGGYCSFHEQPTNGLHEHDFYEVNLVSGGRGTFWHGQQRYKLGVGDVFLARPEVPHEIESHESRNLELYFFMFTMQRKRSHPGTSEGGVENLILEELEHADHLHVGAHRRLIAYLDLLGREVGSEWQARLGMRSFFWDLLASFSEQLGSLEDGPEDRRLARAFDWLEKHVHETVSVPELAERAAMSERSFQRLCRERFGQSAGELIRSRRISHATTRLLMNYPVQEVSEALGFSHVSHFSRHFKKEVGLSPKQFQAKYLRGVGGRKVRHHA